MEKSVRLREMKKVLLVFLLLLLAVFLSANACFEEVENMALSTIAAFSSIPKIPLSGVTVTVNGDELIPEKITYRDSDLSHYLDDLSTKPECSSLWENALYSMTQRGATMQKVKSMLRDAGYREGDVTVSGDISLSCVTQPKTSEIVFSTDLSSIDVAADVDLLLKKAGKNYRIKGTLNIKGDSERVLSVTSENMCVNDTYYRVSLKYRLTKAD